MTAQFAESHILLTGVTGFVGQAVLERLLSSFPDCRVSVVIRPQGDATAAERFRELLGKPVFDVLRNANGDEGVREEARRRVTVLSGDVNDLAAVPADVDIVIHCASNVSFDPPIDEAFSANVAGPISLYRCLLDSGLDPHVVHVSTSYAVGARRGVAPETSLDHVVDYADELAHAQRARARADEMSRTPEVLDMLLRRAQRAHGRAGPRAVAEAAERERLVWIRDRLQDQARSRARSLGWWDAYTLTKALGERVAERMWASAGHRLTVVRPTIIESALRRPYPGWIDGFKVADPLIAAFGRGQLPEFPAFADTVLDIVPVDFVVNAILAAALVPAEPRRPRYVQVSSGKTNPLRMRPLIAMGTEYFGDHPFDNAASAVTNWTFPHPAVLRGELKRRQKAVEVVDAVVAQLPAMTRTREWSATLQKANRELGLLRRMIDIYEPYVQMETVFDDARLRELSAALDVETRRDLSFDVTEIDWRAYLFDVHIPQIPALLRRRADRRVHADSDLPRRDDVLAVFDLQRTVAASSLVEHYLWVELARRPIGALNSLASLIAKSPHYIWTDRRDRSDFIRTFMRRYAGRTEKELRETIAKRVGPSLRRSLLVGAVERIQAHRAAGHRTVLVTGQIDLFVEPLTDLFDEIVAGSMDVDDKGRWTGHLAVHPLVGEARANWLRRYANSTGMDLGGSYAYGDSYADRPWLEAVGNPNVVNPDLQLDRYARQRRWPTHSWTQTVENRAIPILRSVRVGL
jgi:HAD superfamily hydrolase (TIGR01490 family)